MRRFVLSSLFVYMWITSILDVDNYCGYLDALVIFCVIFFCGNHLWIFLLEFLWDAPLEIYIRIFVGALGGFDGIGGSPHGVPPERLTPLQLIEPTKHT